MDSFLSSGTTGKDIQKQETDTENLKFFTGRMSKLWPKLESLGAAFQ